MGGAQIPRHLTEWHHTTVDLTVRLRTLLEPAQDELSYAHELACKILDQLEWLDIWVTPSAADLHEEGIRAPDLDRDRDRWRRQTGADPITGAYARW